MRQFLLLLCLSLAIAGCARSSAPANRTGAAQVVAQVPTNAATTRLVDVPPPGKLTPDVDFEGANRPLAVRLAENGTVLFATLRGLFVWDPRGVETTKHFPVSPEALFGIGARIGAASSPDAVSVAQAASRSAEDWAVHATFSENGAVLLFHSENNSFALSKNFVRHQFVAHAMRVDNGEGISRFAKILRIDSAPEYAFQKSLSPTGRFLLASKPYQLEVFELATGKHLLRRTDNGPSDVALFLNDTMLLTASDKVLRAVDLPSGRVLASQLRGQSHAVSPDRTQIAILERGLIRIWSAPAARSQARCEVPVCDSCVLNWIDQKHVRMFEERTAKTQVTCALESGVATSGAYLPRPIFKNDEFSVAESFEQGAEQPSRVLLTLAKTGQELQLGASQMNYSASPGRLLVQGEGVRMIDARGAIVELIKSR
jgi:hypothetical protein